MMPCTVNLVEKGRNILFGWIILMFCWRNLLMLSLYFLYSQYIILYLGALVLNEVKTNLNMTQLLCGHAAPQ